MTTLDNPNEAIQESTVPFFPTALRYGLYGAAAFIVYTLIANLTGLSIPTSIAISLLNGFIAIGVTVAFVILTIRHHRDKELGGYITFGRAFLVAFIALIIASIISNLFNLLYMTFIDPNYLENVLSATEEMMASMGAPQEVVDEQMASMREKMTPSGMMTQGLLYGAVGSAIISLIAAAIMKKKPAVV